MGVEAQVTRLLGWRHDDDLLAGTGTLPVHPALVGLLPDGLPRGTVTATSDWGLLTVAMAVGASAAGAWCAVAGVPEFGAAAAAGAGLNLSRLLLVPEPGSRWPQVVASLLGGLDVVIVRPPGPVPAQLRRRLMAALRRSGGVLVVAGEWEGAQTRLRVTRQEWAGIGPGRGRLRARRAEVIADGRGGAARPRRQWLWLPGADDAISIADELTPLGTGMEETG
jgi:hypothetical protein